MPIRTISLSLLAVLASVACAQQPQSSTQPPAAAPALATRPAPAATPSTVFTPTPADKNPKPAQFSYYGTEQTNLQNELLPIPATDAERFKRLQDAFTKNNCTTARMHVETVQDKHSNEQNLICTWTGRSPDNIVVVAHYTTEGKGQAAIDNWSGAAMLPALFLAIQNQQRANSWAFVETAGKKGDSDYVKSLSHDDKKNVRAVIAVEGLGVGSGLRFFSPSETPDPTPASYHLQLALLFSASSDNEVSPAQPTNPGRWLTIDDTTPFRYSESPSIIIHSVSQAEADLPGSAGDVASAIDLNAYDANYKALAIFMVALDSVADKLNKDDKLWGAQSGYRLNINDLPYIH
ncbi:MAG TPA: M28 family peptidase [Acidobacteriaceae bacterium]|nr:M28 family peptidase [Acidobacteriaceae bacterium]